MQLLKTKQKKIPNEINLKQKHHSLIYKWMGWACARGAWGFRVCMMMGWYNRKISEGGEKRGRGAALVHVAFGVGLGAHVLGGLFCGVGHSLIQVGQGHCVLLVDVALELGLQAGPLIVGEGQGDEGLGLTHKLVNIALPCHLEREGMA